jgi:hypothetical protein
VRKRTAILAVPGLLLVAALAGCSTNGTAQQNFSGLPPDDVVSQSSEVTNEGLQAFWLEDGAEIAVSIPGSSSCPTIGRDLVVVRAAGDGNVVSLQTEPPKSGPCTQDISPHTTTYYTPGPVTTTRPLTIIVGAHKVVLPPK